MASARLQITRLRRRVRQLLLATALMMPFAALDYAQEPPTNEGADIAVFRVQAWGFLAADFSTRVSNYVALRGDLENGLPVLTVTDDAGEIVRAQRRLAGKIRVARAGTRQGEIFTPAVSVAFRDALRPEMDPGTMAAVMDENPGEFSRLINRTYDPEKPLATMPPNLLAVLPRLPDDLQYRFLGRTLILLDTRANLILDRVPCAISCFAD